MPSITPEDSRAILIGMSNFPRDPDHLPPLPAVRNNVAELKRILADPQNVGIPDKNITTVVDEPNATNVAETLARVFRDATDTLIIYYAGHGLISRNSSDLLVA